MTRLGFNIIYLNTTISLPIAKYLLRLGSSHAFLHIGQQLSPLQAIRGNVYDFFPWNFDSSGVTRGEGRADRPGWHHPGGDTRMKYFLWLNLERTLDKRRRKVGVVRRRQLKKVITSQRAMTKNRWHRQLSPRVSPTLLTRTPLVDSCQVLLERFLFATSSWAVLYTCRLQESMSLLLLQGATRAQPDKIIVVCLLWVIQPTYNTRLEL